MLKDSQILTYITETPWLGSVSIIHYFRQKGTTRRNTVYICIAFRFYLALLLDGTCRERERESASNRSTLMALSPLL